MKKRAIVAEFISFLLVLLFVYAAVSKLFDYQKFTVQIGQSPLLTGFGDTLPWIVITTELILAGMFCFARLRLMAFYGSFILMTLFTLYVIAILNFSPYIPCSCGGILEQLGWKEHLMFNASFTLLSLAGIILQARIDAAVQPTEHYQNPTTS